MPEQRDDAEFVAEWFKRIEKAKKYKKDKWEEVYEVSRCKRYWKGDQLDEPLDVWDQRKVQINRVHPAVKASMPSLYFANPFARVMASPALADTPGQKPGVSIDDKAQLLQDFGNTLIRRKDTNFKGATHLALKESQWAMGCVRVRYDAEPVENPRVEAPPIQESEDTPNLRNGEFLGLNPPGPMIASERFYVQRIPARQVLCSADQSGTLEENAWVGYWSIHYVADIKKSKLYRNVENLEPSGERLDEDDGEANKESAGDKVKLYHIWTLRDRMNLVFASGHERPIREARYKRLPLKFLMLDQDPDEFYPVPPIFHMLHPQDEINDSREWLRLNRKGTVPRYTYDEDAVEPSEMKKLESGEMGTYIKRKQGTTDPIQAVSQPNYSVVATQTLGMAMQEFTELSMVTPEQRGVPQSKTATQAKLVEVRSQVQESFDRALVAEWLASIIEEMILLAVDRMSQVMWILNNADPEAAGFPMESMRISEMYRSITHQDLREAVDGVRWEVTIESSSMSPVAEQEERENWMQAMSAIRDPITMRLMVASPELRKKTLNLLGVKSARDQELIAQAFAAVLEMERQAAMMGAPTPGQASAPAGGPRRPPRPPGIAPQAGAPPNTSTGGASPPNIPASEVMSRMGLGPGAGRVPM